MALQRGIEKGMKKGVGLIFVALWGLGTKGSKDIDCVFITSDFEQALKSLYSCCLQAFYN